MTSPLHSIRWRVQLWHGLILLVALAGLSAAIYQIIWENELRRIDRELIAREREVFFALAQTGNGEPVPPPIVFKRLQAGQATLPANLTQGDALRFNYFSFRDRDGRVLLESPHAPPDMAFLPVPARGFAEENRTIAHRRELIRSADFGLRAVFGRELTPEIEQMRRLAWSLSAATLAVWLVGLAGGWWLGGRAIRPIERISHTAARIAEGNLAERIATARGASELDQLGRVLNRTFDRLHEALEVQRQFTADAAHELRTPITILTAETQRILKRARSAEEYRAAFENCGQTVARMRRLVEDLLLLARQESTISQTHQLCDLAKIVRDSIEQLAPLAAVQNIQLHTDLRPAICLGHSAALITVASNLIGNAIQHRLDKGGKAAADERQQQQGDCRGHVYISTKTEAGCVVLTVRDDGPGIAAEDLPHIFDRFYRADRARTADTSHHTGLGLAIVKTTIEAHEGTIECQSQTGLGTTLVATVPSFESQVAHR